MNDLFVSGETPDWVRDLPNPFHDLYLGVHVWQWIGLVLLVLVSLISMFIGNRVTKRILKVRDKYLPGEVTAKTNVALRRAGGLVLGVLVCFPFTGPLSLPAKFDRGILFVLEGMIILAFSMLVYAIWDAVCDNMATHVAGVSLRAERLLVPMTRKFVRLIIVIVGTFVAMSTLFHINVAAVIASLGIGGIVVALAAKDSVENIFGSLTILFDMPFQIGDWIRIDKIEGIVEQINLRSTRIRTFEDTIITLPNANLIRASLENVSARRYRRQKFNVRVSYDTPPDRVNAFCSDVRAFLAEQEYVQTEKIIVDFSEMDDTALTVLVQCHFEAENQAEELEKRHRLIVEIMSLRLQHGIPFLPAGVARLPEPPPIAVGNEQEASGKPKEKGPRNS